MKFGDIRRLILFGGSQLTVKLLRALSGTSYEVIVFTSPRQLRDIVTSDGLTLQDCFRRDKVTYFCVSDINKSSDLKKCVDGRTLGLGMGEVWHFSSRIIRMFHGRLLDFMGIPLPQFRGGAHYTWQLLMSNRSGACNLQEINEDTVPAKFDSGKIVKCMTYKFPRSATTPQDFFDHAGKQEIPFLMDFLRQIRIGRTFHPRKLNETESMLLPRLNTMEQGWIDWRWTAREIERFVNAFGCPYPGASTLVNKKRIFLRKARWLRIREHFHPFQAGLVFRKDRTAIYIAVRGGAVRVSEIYDGLQHNILKKVSLGDRFWTPESFLDKAMMFKAEYDKHGKD